MLHWKAISLHAAATSVLGIRPLFAARADKVVLVADALVALRGEIIGEPTDLEETARMLRHLSGQTHEVCSTVFIYQQTAADAFWVRHLPLFAVRFSATLPHAYEIEIEVSVVCGTASQMQSATQLATQSFSAVHMML